MKQATIMTEGIYNDDGRKRSRLRFSGEAREKGHASRQSRLEQEKARP